MFVLTVESTIHITLERVLPLTNWLGQWLSRVIYEALPDVWTQWTYTQMKDVDLKSTTMFLVEPRWWWYKIRAWSMAMSGGVERVRRSTSLTKLD